jgi:hypothetical protein
VGSGEVRVRFSVDEGAVNGWAAKEAVGLDSVRVTFLMVTFLITR